MDKQQSDHIENRFRQAAENFLPPSNEAAWEKMEAMLDKDKDRKRPFIWFWPLALLGFLVLGGASLHLYFTNRHKNAGAVLYTGIRKVEKPVSAFRVDEDKNKKGSVSTAEVASKPGSQIPAGDGHVPLAAAPPGRSMIPEHGNRMNLVKAAGPAPHNSGRFKSDHSPDKKNLRVKISNKTVSDDPVTNTRQANELPLPFYDLPLLYRDEAAAEIEIPASMVQSVSNRLRVQDSLQHAAGDAKPAKEKAPWQSKFYVIASLGMNATLLHKLDTKNTGMVYGGEIGCHLNSFISLQAGFHAVRKIYFAGPGDYKFNPDSVYWRTVTILKINANCLIFDVPLSVRYDMLHNRHTALYAITGLSSFIMKSEDYDYHFNTSSGWYRKTEMKYRGNVNLFSSANVSVGVEQRLFKNLSIQAEPYMKLPISGIGEGKIKLYSLGVQVGLKYQPLNK